jgi:hypothetical protein
MPTEAILSTARQFLGVDPTVPITLLPIKRGASGRTIVRVKAPNHETFIGIHWTEEREDNSQFIPVAQFLKQAKLRVPAIIHDRSRHRVALVEDLGDTDLLSFKDQPFSSRLPLYRSAFEQVDRLFYAKAPKNFHLMPAFDARLYRWNRIISSNISSRTSSAWMPNRFVKIPFSVRWRKASEPPHGTSSIAISNRKTCW